MKRSIDMQATWVAMLCIVLISPTCANGQEKKKNGDETLKRVLATYEARTQQMNPIYVRYRVTEIETAAWVVVSRNLKNADGLLPEQSTRKEGEYARKGNKIRSFVHLVDAPPGVPVLTDWNRESFWIYNGEISIRKSNREKEYLLTKKTDPWWWLEPPTMICPEEGVLSSLRQWVAGSSKAVSQVTERMDGDRRIIDVDIQYPDTKWSNKIRFLPDKDYAIEHMESFNAIGGRVEVKDVTAFQTVNGLIYPKSAVRKHYMREGKLASTHLLEVDSVELDAGKVPDSLFQFEIPKGSTLFDEDLKTTVRQSEVSESQLDEVVRRLAPPIPLWKRWWMIAAAVVGAAILVWLYRVRFRKQRAV